MADPPNGAAEEPGHGALYDIASLRAARKRPGSQTTRRQAGATPEQVRSLKERIARGEYHPDPDEIARKLIENGF